LAAPPTVSGKKRLRADSGGGLLHRQLKRGGPASSVFVTIPHDTSGALSPPSTVKFEGQSLFGFETLGPAYSASLSSSFNPAGQAAGQQLVTPTSEQVRMFHSAAIPQGALAVLGESPTGSPYGPGASAVAAALRARSNSSRSPPGPLGTRSLGGSMTSLSSASTSASPTTAGTAAVGAAVRAAVVNLTPTTTPPARSPLVSGPAPAAEPTLAAATTATGRAAVSRPPGSRRRTWIGWRGHTLPRLASLNTTEFPVVLQPRDAARLAAEAAEEAGLPVEAAAPSQSAQRRRSRTVTTGGGGEALDDVAMAEVDGGGDAAATAVSSEGGGDGGGGATTDDDGGSGELSPATQDRQRRRRNAEAARRTRQRKAQTLRYFRERSAALEEQERSLHGEIAVLTEEQTVLRARNGGLEARIEAMESELAAVRDALVAAGIQMRHGLVVGGAGAPGQQDLPGGGGGGGGGSGSSGSSGGVWSRRPGQLPHERG
ncbi:hypothetical protein HK405_012762, partial [Cladochytrium tenue]